MTCIHTFLNLPKPAMPDPVDAAAVELVRSWLRDIMAGRGPILDEWDIPALALTPDTLTRMVKDIADAMRAAQRGAM